mmetsp:Transcript_4279/g.16367  ORF Transcript_4279/g.16367 Transcript_4279/m.16367 type:complete len:315 (+) Transcript_4279:650-1594(+)
MQRYVHDALVFVHDVLDAVTVVHVPIDYQDSLAQFCLDHRSCSHDGVIEKTKSHRLSAHRVMSRWSHHRERSVYVSSPHRQTRLRDRPRRHARPLRRMLREEDVIAEHVLASHNLYLLSIDVERRIDERHVFLRVRARQLRLRRLSRLQPFASQIQFLRLDLIHDDPMSRRLFEVSLLFVHFHRVVVKQPHAALRRRFVALELHRGHIGHAHRARVRVLPQRRRCLHARDRMLFVLARSQAERAEARHERVDIVDVDARVVESDGARLHSGHAREDGVDARVDERRGIGRFRWFLFSGRHRRTTASRAARRCLR